MGVPVGKVIDYKKGIAKIKLTDNISIGSGLRVIGKKNDVGISVNEIYVNNTLIKKASKGDIVSIKVNGEVNPDDIVVITMDKEISDNIEDIVNSNLRKVNITGKFYGHVGSKMSLTLNDGINEISVSGSLVESSLNRPMDKDTISEKLNKLGDTVYKFDKLEIDIDDNIFIPIKEINELRRKACEKLNELRLYKSDFKKCEYYIDVPNFDKERLITCLVNGIDTYNNLDREYDIVYSEFVNDKTIYKLPRVIKEYKNSDKLVMVGDIGAFNKLKNVDTDFSLNVVNSYTVAFLHSLGARKVTLSYELNDNQIKDIIDNYHNRYGKHPNVELIVNAYEEVMISKFSLNKYFDNDKIYLRDMFKNKYSVITKNNLMYIYNYKKRDCYNIKYYDMGVNSLRINLDI